MPTRKNDRRVGRSRDALLNALASLLHERGYERLTIQNVLDRAGVGRATFYAHFHSKDELLASSVERMRAWLVQQGKSAAQGSATSRRLGFTLSYFQHVASHRRIYEISVVRPGEHTVERYMRDMLKDLVREDLASCPEGHRAPPASLEIAVQYVTGALFSLVLWWLEHKQPLSSEEVNDLFQRLTFPGLDVALGPVEARMGPAVD